MTLLLYSQIKVLSIYFDVFSEKVFNILIMTQPLLLSSNFSCRCSRLCPGQIKHCPVPLFLKYGRSPHHIFFQCFRGYIRRSLAKTKLLLIRSIFYSGSSPLAWGFPSSGSKLCCGSTGPLLFSGGYP